MFNGASRGMNWQLVWRTTIVHHIDCLTSATAGFHLTRTDVLTTRGGFTQGYQTLVQYQPLKTTASKNLYNMVRIGKRFAL